MLGEKSQAEFLGLRFRLTNFCAPSQRNKNVKINREMIKQALRKEVSCNQIAASRNVSHNTVRRALRLAEAAGITPDTIDDMSDTELSKIFHPSRQLTNYIYPDCEAELALSLIHI